MSRAIWWACCAALLALACLVRWDMAAIHDGAGFYLNDADTLRRLVRLAAIDSSDVYPVVETVDGWPGGTVSHWTLPMDVVIRVLNPLGRLLFDARGYEPGAILAGPLLACCSLLAFLLLVRRLLGAPGALLAGLFYALAYQNVLVSQVGNGDHQNLQHLALLVSVLLFVRDAGERSSTAAAVLSGAAMGLAVWVSTESMLVFYIVIAARFAVSSVRGGEHVARERVRWVSGLLAVALVGHLLENRGDVLAFEADKISCWQLYQFAVYALFAFLVLRGGTSRARQGVAAASALAAGLLPVLLVAPFRGAITARLDAFAGVNVWLQTEVVEFRGLFTDYDLDVSVSNALAIESWLLLLFPLLLALTAVHRRLPRGTRVALVLVAATSFALEVWEVKLGHVFQITYAVVIAAGLREARARWLAPIPVAVAGGAAALLVGAAARLSLPERTSTTFFMQTLDYWARLTARLRGLARGQPRAAVLAPWGLAPWLMYYGDLPVVASNYHRNIEGIRDGYRIWLDTTDGHAEARRLLRERRVGLVVATYNWPFLAHGATVLGRPPLAERRDGAWHALPGAERTYYWRLRQDGSVPGMRLVHTDAPVRVPGRRGEEPLFKVFRVVD